MKRILITPGEPAGVGPDITIHLAQQDWPVELVVIADPKLLEERAKLLNIDLKLIECDFNVNPLPQKAGSLNIFPISLRSPTHVKELNVANADYVIATLKQAAVLCMEKKASAVVTGPVHKGIINQAGIHFTGHTEFFAEQCHVQKTVMLFVVDQLKVALVTTHLPLANVSPAITKTLLKQTLSVLIDGLQKNFDIHSPKILVCGLNPHAGEGGYLGREEIETITPVLDEFREKGQQIVGPLSADTIFTQTNIQKSDAILAMYHDQALPIVKYIGFGHAVNVTLGLPFVRTSVDHGTALDIAGTNVVDPKSMHAALQLAIELVTNSG